MPERTLTVPPAEEGRTLAEVLRSQLGLPSSQIRRLVEAGHVVVKGKACRDTRRVLHAGQKLQVRTPAEPRPHGAPENQAREAVPVIRYADPHVVVVDKPAGLTTMRHAHEAAEFGKHGQHYLPTTLADQLPDLLARDGVRPRVRAVHRLDKETSGLVVFARTAAAERHLGNQFRAHTITRTYLALVRGRAVTGRVESFLVEDRGDGRRGSASKPGDGKHAVTHVRVLEELGDYTLVECSLETGRTHQVRIHLGESGTPLCGERVYDRPVHGKPLPDGSGAVRPLLHAASLGFVHPATGKTMNWTAAPPRDLKEMLERLRRAAAGAGVRPPLG